MAKNTPLKNQLDLMINLKTVGEYFSKKMPPSEYSVIMDKLNDLYKECTQSFGLKEFKNLKLSEWTIHTIKQDKEIVILKRFEEMIRLSSHIHPFILHLEMKNAKGNPIIAFKVFSKYDYTPKYEKEIILKRREKKETLRKELINYWETGKIIKEVSSETEATLVPFKEAMKNWTNKKLKDSNGKILKSTHQQCIVYLYSQFVNKSEHLLSTEPIEWNIPKVLINHISTGLADSLQDNHYSLKTPTEYNKFMKFYPSLENFAASFDLNYL